MVRTILAAAVASFLLLTTAEARASSPEAGSSVATEPPVVLASTPNAEVSGFNPLPTHHFTWAPSDAKDVQLGVNFGLLQLALGGFNVAGELRYRRLWLEYSHGVELHLNDLGGFTMTGAERSQNLHMFMPYTTGFGVGFTVLDELWLGVEFKTHRYDVNAPGGAVSSYQTFSVGPVLGYKLFIWKGLYANAYARYWPNVASSLPNNEIALRGADGTVMHAAHDFGAFANLSIGYAFDL